MSDIDTTAADEADVVLAAPEDFDMYALMEGVDYPEDEVTVALNEKAAHRLARLDREIRAYLAEGEEEGGEHDQAKLAQYRTELDKLQKAIADSRVTFYLKGVPDELVQGANDIVEARFEDKKKQVKTADNRLVKVLPEGEKMAWVRFLNAVVYSMHIQRVYYHKNGATITAPDADQIAHFYDKAPAAAQALLTSKIQELRVDAQEYERDFDEGFFPKS